MNKLKRSPARKHYYMKFDVNDFDNEIKLKDCDAIAHGVYIKVLILLFRCEPRGMKFVKHKGMEQFAHILHGDLHMQNGMQNENICIALASTLASYFSPKIGFTVEECQQGFYQLLENDVLYIDKGYLCQKRMIRDSEISMKRKLAAENRWKNKKNSTAEPVAKKPDLEEVLDGKMEEVLDVNLHMQNGMQNDMQKCIYLNDDDYNNINNKKREGGIGNVEGVQGAENLGEEKKKSDQPKKHPILQTYQPREENLQKFIDTYFSPEWDRAREVLEMRVLKVRDEALLRRWAVAFNEFLVLSGEMPGYQQEWSKHFGFWLQKQDTKIEPEKLADSRRNSGPFFGGKNRTLSTQKPVSKIDQKIAAAANPEERRKLEMEKYALRRPKKA